MADNVERIITSLETARAALGDPDEIGAPAARRRCAERVSVLSQTVQALRNKRARAAHLASKLAATEASLAQWAEVEGRLRAELEELRATPVEHPNSWPDRALHARTEQDLVDSLEVCKYGWSRETPGAFGRAVDAVFEEGARAILQGGWPAWRLELRRKALAEDVTEAEAALAAVVKAAQTQLAAGVAAPVLHPAADAQLQQAGAA